MVRTALGALLLVAGPLLAQGIVTPRVAAVESAARCVHAAMTDALLPVGAAPEQIVKVALARCFDEIEAAASASESPVFARVALRRELYDYALHVAGGMPGHNRYDVAALPDATAMTPVHHESLRLAQ